ncbi:Transcriptional regulatory protein ZraR [compost metagenome]
MTFNPPEKFPPENFPSETILLVDDDEKLLGILKQWLVHSGYLVETVTSGMQAIQRLQDQSFELVIIDLKLPDLDGLQLLTIIRALQPKTQVIILSGQGTMDDAIKALREGRSFDFLRKPLTHLRELNLAINKALAKRRQTQDAETSPLVADRPPHEPLSEREIGILTLVAEGCDNREIAKRLILSDKTVRNHLSRIYMKLKVANRTQAVTQAQKYGYLSK